MEFIDLKTQYHKYKQDIDKEILEVLESAKYILGPKNTELEQKLAAYVGVKHGLGVSSGTDALLFALMALGIKRGDEVITSPMTFIATSEVVDMLGAKPVFVDIEPEFYNLNPEKIREKITKKTKAIIPVSLYGQCAEMKAINAIGAEYNLPVIEDACQSFGARNEDGKSCGLSLLSCTSFFPSKPLGCYGDGGMIFTNDDALATEIKKIRVHGQAERYVHEVLGCNGRLDSIQAAILLVKFAHLEEELKLRAAAGEYYIKGLTGLKGIVAPKTKPGNTHVFAQFSIQTDDREGLTKHLNSNGVPTAIHYPIPLHLQPVYKRLKIKKGSLPVSEALASKILSLPMHPYISCEDQDKVIGLIREFSEKR